MEVFMRHRVRYKLVRSCSEDSLIQRTSIFATSAISRVADAR
jgi:hypothetical protein